MCGGEDVHWAVPIDLSIAPYDLGKPVIIDLTWKLTRNGVPWNSSIPGEWGGGGGHAVEVKSYNRVEAWVAYGDYYTPITVHNPTSTSFNAGQATITTQGSATAVTGLKIAVTPIAEKYVWGKDFGFRLVDVWFKTGEAFVELNGNGSLNAGLSYNTHLFWGYRDILPKLGGDSDVQ